MSTRRRTAILAIAAIAIVIAVASVLVASTYHEVGLTIDEPTHIAAGYDWLTGEPYTFDVEHPPLTRALFAVPLVLDDAPKPPKEGSGLRGVFLLDNGGPRYLPRLTSARSTNLLFLILALAGVAAWAWRHIGPFGAVIAALLFAMLPPLLAHAGLTTTDAGGTALLPWALLALERWIDRPTAPRAAILGLAIGLGMAAKFSFIPFFGAAALMIVILRRFRPRKTALVALAVASLVVWAAYRFEVGTIAGSHERGAEMVEMLSPRFAKPITAAIAKHLVLPAPNFFHGMMDVALHNRRGHWSGYLFGEYSTTGWWYYFPAAIALKTPLAFLLLMLAGTVLAVRRRDWLLPAILLAMFVVTFRVNINIGVRHALPIYVPMALLAADAVVRARGLWRVASAALVAVAIAVTVAAHPDYIPWFNTLGGRHPEKKLADSNFDWGQDGLRLVRLCRQLGVPPARLRIVHFFLMMEPALQPNRGVRLQERLHDEWIAVSDGSLEMLEDKNYAVLQDLARATRRYRVGKTFTLYYIPP